MARRPIGRDREARRRAGRTHARHHRVRGAPAEPPHRVSPLVDASGVALAAPAAAPPHRVAHPQHDRNALRAGSGRRPGGNHRLLPGAGRRRAHQDPGGGREEPRPREDPRAGPRSRRGQRRGERARAHRHAAPVGHPGLGDVPAHRRRRRRHDPRAGDGDGRRGPGHCARRRAGRFARRSPGARRRPPVRCPCSTRSGASRG